MMIEMYSSLIAEWYKVRRSSFLWVTFVAFSLGPIMGGLILFLIASADPALEGGMLMEKAKMMGFEVNWESYMALLAQVVGVGGVLVFGFVISWLFGREYSDQTTKDLLALPTSRNSILSAKFILYVLWCMALVLSNFILALVLGKLLGLGLISFSETSLIIYLLTTILVICLGPPIAFFSLWGQGYMVPLGFVTLMLVISQIIGAIGYGHYFPWALPGLFSGSAGVYRDLINSLSYFILLSVCVSGIIATYWYWNRSDQHG
ncbi:MAG: ABC transporter permease [Saprospiraceae bacterium]|nr:ABC transporter permease [Saprospiraceae bacterium]